MPETAYQKYTKKILPNTIWSILTIAPKLLLPTFGVLVLVFAGQVVDFRIRSSWSSLKVSDKRERRTINDAIKVIIDYMQIYIDYIQTSQNSINYLFSEIFMLWKNIWYEKRYCFETDFPCQILTQIMQKILLNSFLIT